MTAMGQRRADQILAGFADGDAISHEAIVIRDLLRKWGWTSDIYAVMEHVSVTPRKECRPLAEYQAGPRDIVLHHYSIGSPALDAFARTPARKVLVYHNITPSSYFRGFDDHVAGQLDKARSTLKAIGRQVEAIWAVSEFNARELRELGLSNVSVFPLLFSPAQLDLPPEPEVLARFAVKLKTILYVGRIAPNKKVEALIEAFYWYFKTINPFSRLVIVGSERSCPRYFAMLRMLVGDFDLPNVCFEGFASPAGLPAYYKSSDLFVTTSEHEGYCLPLLEAMYMGVPAIAPASGGIPEAMGRAGVQYEQLKPSELAGLMDRVLEDGGLRQRVLDAQKARIGEVLKRDVEGELRQLMQGVAGTS